MDYMVYTFGGGDTLVQVFNAVGRIFESDSEYLTPIGKFAMGLGALWAGMKAIFKGNITDFGMGWLFPSFFAFVFLFAPKASVWVKDEVSMSAPVKIDNIPIGIAFFSSISSRISYSLSEMLEKHLLPPDAGLASRKTGIMFGAKAVGKIRDVQIQDPTLLRNTKEFMRQCFTKPYIIGDILGKKGEAQNSNDIMDFLEKNPPNNFGIYYRDQSNSTTTNTFKTCKQAIPLIKESLNKELSDGLLTKFAAVIGVQSDRPEMLKDRLKIMTSDTLKYLKKDQADIHQWMKQAMLLNANRESYDDWREKYSLNRIYPELIAMNATRGMFQQSFGWITAGEMAANIMPILQSAFFAVIICLIFIVFPMSMLPGGINVLKTWIMLMIWVNSWPVFFTIIHCLGMISLASKSAGFGNGSIVNDGGMSILSQGGFSEITLNTYATYQLFAASVPMLAYAVLKGCTHATTALAGYFAPTGTAASIGSNTVDNNLTIDTIAHGGRSIGQEQYAPTLNIGGGVIDDGGMRVVTPDYGGNYGSNGEGQFGPHNQIVTQPVDSLPTNYNKAETISDSIQTQLSDQQSRMAAHTNRSSELASKESRQLTDLARRISSGDATIASMSVSEQEALRETLSQGLSVNDNLSHREGKDTATSSSAKAGLEFAGSGASISVNSGNSDAVSKEKSATQQKAYNEAMEKVKSAARSNNINSTSDDVKSLTQGLSQTMSEQTSVGREMAKTDQAIQSLQHQRSYVNQNSASINRNFNDAVLQKVIDTHPEIGSKEQAARWISSHPSQTDALARAVMGVFNPFSEESANKNLDNPRAKSESLSSINSKLEGMPMRSKDDLRDDFQSSAKTLENQATVPDDTGHRTSITQKVKGDIDTAKTLYSNNNDGNNQNVREVLHNTLSPAEKERAKNLHSLPSNLSEDQKNLEDKYNDTDDSTAMRTVDQAIENYRELQQKNEIAKDKFLNKK